MEQLLVFNNIELYLIAATGLFFIIQLLYYLVVYARPARRAKEGVKAQEAIATPAVSIVVYAKNESANLREYLPSLLTQDYPQYEVIVINDGSTDESEDVLKTFEYEYKHLYHTYIPEEARYLSRRKLGLTVGIKAAKYDILLFTEANCFPQSDQWIRNMAAAYTPDTSMLLGYCAYGSYKGLLHKLIAYDNLLMGLQYLSPALAGHPFTGSGRNLSYRKEMFFNHKGFYNSLNLQAGDDDLFVNELATGKNTRAVITPDSITEMARMESFGIWKEMKVSRATTRRHHKGWSLRFYRMETVSFFLFLLAVVASVAMGVMGNWLISVMAGLLYLSLCITKAAVLAKASKLLHQKPQTYWLPLLELLHPLLSVYIRIYRRFRGKSDYTFRLVK